MFEDNLSLISDDDGDLQVEGGDDEESESKDNENNLHRSNETEEVQQNEVNTYIENVISQSSDEGLGEEDKRLQNIKRGTIFIKKNVLKNLLKLKL